MEPPRASIRIILRIASCSRLQDHRINLHLKAEAMSSLFNNAVASIRMGVEDFQRNDADRSLSAVRNLYSGTLLLAKEVLVRKAPNADIKDVLASSYEVVPDGHGGIAHKPNQNTVDFNSLANRLKAFGVSINSQKLNNALKSLNKIRNDIEHLYTPERLSDRG